MTLWVATMLESWENGGRQQRNAVQYAVQLHAHSIKRTRCIQMSPLPAPRYGSNTAVCVAWVVSTRCAINSITGFTFWKQITGWKPVYRFSNYRFNISNLNRDLTALGIWFDQEKIRFEHPRFAIWFDSKTVSYTHLTLPTIYSV